MMKENVVSLINRSVSATQTVHQTLKQQEILKVICINTVRKTCSVTTSLKLGSN